MKYRKLFSALSLVMAVIMIAAVIVPLFFYTAEGKSIQELTNAAEALAKEKKQIEDELEGLGVAKENQIKRKLALDKQIKVAEKEIDNLNLLITAITKQIEDKEVEIAAAEVRVQNQYDDLKVRIRANYEAGETSYLDVLLSSESFSDILVKLDIVQNIIEYDQRQLIGLRTAKAELETAKAEKEEVKAQREESKTELESKKTSLEKSYKESLALISEIETNTKDFEEQYKKIEEDEERIQKEIKAALAASKGEYVGGTFSWPLPGYSNITSEYGYREHPITKVNKLHTGVDIGAPRGAKIIAANTGTVITATYSSSYGNYVVIDHGGGWGTLYGHMTNYAVSKGDKVVKGDVIGYVGSTGYSTGPHLHFEIIKSGETQDPMTHFTKK